MGSTAIAADKAITVRVGIYENQPKIFTDSKGNVTGFYPDIITYIASQEGWKIEWVPGSWSDCLQRLDDGEIDVMPDVAYSEDRNNAYAFSQETLYTSWSRVYTRFRANINSILDLEGKNIAVLKGSINVEGPEGIKQLVKAYNISCTFTEVDSYDEVFELVESEKADAGVVTKDFGYQKESDYKVVKTAIIFQPLLLYFAFPKNSSSTPYLIERIDYHLKALKQDNNSIYYRSLDKWLAVKPVEEPIIPGWIIWTLVGVGGLVLLLAGGSYVLSYQVRARTKALTDEITKRKPAEEALRANERRLASIYDTVGDVIFHLAAEPGGLYRFSSVNRAFERVTGLPAEAVVGKTVNEIIPEPSLSVVLAQYQRAIVEKSVVRWEEISDYPTGRLFGEGSVAPVFDDAGNCTHLVGSVHDITERKLAEDELKKYREHLEELVTERTSKLEEKTEELEQANIRLQELDRLKSVFLASMSHELRTPLNSIIGFTGIILQGMSGDISPEQRKQLTMVKGSATHLLSLINDVLDISKIEAGKVELVLEEFNFEDIVREVVGSFSTVLNEKGMEVQVELPPSIMLYSDKRRIKQVLMNLVSNAVKFTDHGSIKISAVVLENDRLAVHVKDAGVGIRREDMSKLFVPFQQVDMALTKKHEGTGLGLYLVKKLAEILGGDVEAQSEYGKGSQFSFSIPLRYRNESEE